jgi:L-ascorbate metabolism protein UlaG (beta-lactamase superfamily)
MPRTLFPAREWHDSRRVKDRQVSLLTLAGVTAAAAAAAVYAERRLFAAPRFRGPVSDHFDGRRFHNHGDGWQSEGSFLRWQMTKEPGEWPEWIESKPGPPPPRHVEDGRVRITWINHASMLIQMDGVNILTDPIWSERCSPVSFVGPRRHRAPGLRFLDLPPIDVVLVSHNHYDHMDVPTLRKLASARIVAPLGNRALLGRYGISSRDLDWWQPLPLSRNVVVTAVPAQHFSARALSDRNAALWGGYVITGPSGSVYFAGDTGWGEHFEQIRERFGSPRVALLPIGAYLPRWFMKPAHISPDEAVEAHAVLGATTTIPMHFGTFRLGDDGYEEPLRDLRSALGPRKGFVVLEHGKGWEAE